MKAAALLIALLPAPALAQAAGQWRGPESIWRATCSYCHDAGGPGPALKGRKLDPALIATVVRSGLPGMPNFHPSEIGDADLTGLARWIAAAPASAAKAK